MADFAPLTVSKPQADSPEVLTFAEYASTQEALTDGIKRSLGDWLQEHKLHPASEEHRDESENPGTLGLAFQPSGAVYASHFVGQVWIRPRELAIIVKPKRGNMLHVATSMLRRSLVDPHVAAHLDEMFWFWPEQDPITFDRTFTGLDFVVSVLYLKHLHSLCQRHLRRSFQKEVSNLCGRVRGKILVAETVRRNLALARPDRACCSYQVHTIDTPANRVLRAALEQARRCLYRAGLKDTPAVLEWLATCHATLDSVPLARIELNDVTRLTPRAAVDRPYKEPLRLAKMVLMLFGSDPTIERRTDEAKIPPFAIDMNELFERYCEALLRSGYPNLVAFYRRQNLGSKLRVRPDFIVPGDQISRARILDAKYKYCWNGEKEDRPDVYQLLAYSRHNKVLSRLHEEPGQQTRLFILYPAETQIPANPAAKLDLDQAQCEYTDDLNQVTFFSKQVPLPQ